MTKTKKEEGYYGRGETFPFGNNVIEIAADEVKNHEFDCILFQTNRNYLVDQYEILSDEQRQLPRIYLEHDPPAQHPTNTKHIVQDQEIAFVHVTHFNKLMWDNGNVSTKVIEHGVIEPEIKFTGELEKGIVVINGIVKRGRRLGYDVFKKVSEKIPLDIVGMFSEDAGGLGEINNRQLSLFISKYRFFFNPIRYTSLGLSVCEAMMTGVPVVGLATTEMVVTVKNDYSGYVHTDVDFLIEKMQMLLDNPQKAAELGKGAQAYANERFNIERFKQDWLDTFDKMIDRTSSNKNRLYKVA